MTRALPIRNSWQQESLRIALEWFATSLEHRLHRLNSHMLRWILLASCLCPGFLNAQKKDLPKELTEYVQFAQKAGLTPKQIEQNALKAGWPAQMVAAALPSASPAAVGTPVSAPELPAPRYEKSLGSAPAAAITTIPPAAPSPANSSKELPAATPQPPVPAGPAATNLGTSAASDATAAAPSPDEYVIGEGDVLGINVFEEPTASVAAVVVRPDGKISVPLLKDVAVAGLTPKQVEKIITDQLAGVIRAPDVTVVVSQTNSKKVYILGAVKKEGPIAFTYRMTVLQAITEAGGLTDYAKRRKIWVLRNENGKEYKLPFDYDAVIKGEHFELNIPLQPGDQIVVPH